tara:strand:- start:65 stop:229 length:165 start_codon:yes stop_codon:yes gene_type:complete
MAAQIALGIAIDTIENELIAYAADDGCRPNGFGFGKHQPTKRLYIELLRLTQTR